MISFVGARPGPAEVNLSQNFDLDSLHVACALELKADRFWTFDERQAKLAKAEGLKA